METIAVKYPNVQNFINGQFADGDEGTSPDILSPIDSALLSSVLLTGAKSFNKAIAAFTEWPATPVKERVQIFSLYRQILLQNKHELSLLITEENAKAYGESNAEIEKTIELTAFACSLPQIISGEVLEVSKDVECKMDHDPPGVVASIVPFNFPGMVPHWSIPNALVLSNTMVIKPSEQVSLNMVPVEPDMIFYVNLLVILFILPCGALL